VAGNASDLGSVLPDCCKPATPLQKVTADDHYADADNRDTGQERHGLIQRVHRRYLPHRITPFIAGAFRNLQGQFGAARKWPQLRRWLSVMGK